MQRLIEILKEYPVQALVALLIFGFLLSEYGFLWAAGGAVVMFGIGYLKANALNPYAKKWVKVGGAIVVVLWLAVLFLRAGIS